MKQIISKGLALRTKKTGIWKRRTSEGVGVITEEIRRPTSLVFGTKKRRM